MSCPADLDQLIQGLLDFASTRGFIIEVTELESIVPDELANYDDLTDIVKLLYQHGVRIDLLEEPLRDFFDDEISWKERILRHIIENEPLGLTHPEKTFYSEFDKLSSGSHEQDIERINRFEKLRDQLQSEIFRFATVREMIAEHLRSWSAGDRPLSTIFSNFPRKLHKSSRRTSFSALNYTDTDPGAEETQNLLQKKIKELDVYCSSDLSVAPDDGKTRTSEYDRGFCYPFSENLRSQILISLAHATLEKIAPVRTAVDAYRKSCITDLGIPESELDLILAEHGTGTSWISSRFCDTPLGRLNFKDNIKALKESARKIRGFEKEFGLPFSDICDIESQLEMLLDELCLIRSYFCTRSLATGIALAKFSTSEAFIFGDFEDRFQNFALSACESVDSYIDFAEYEFPIYVEHFASFGVAVADMTFVPTLSISIDSIMQLEWFSHIERMAIKSLQKLPSAAEINKISEWKEWGHSPGAYEMIPLREALSTCHFDESLAWQSVDRSCVDQTDQPCAIYERFEVALFLQSALNSLTDIERHVLQGRFGLVDDNFYTLEALGTLFGLTRERIRQIQTKALRRLRSPARCLSLRSLLDYDR